MDSIQYIIKNFLLEKCYFRFKKFLEKEKISPSYIDIMKKGEGGYLRVYATRDIPKFGMRKRIDNKLSDKIIHNYEYSLFSDLKIIIPLEAQNEEIGFIPEEAAYVNIQEFPSRRVIPRGLKEREIITNKDIDLKHLANINEVCLGDDVPRRFAELRGSLFDEVDRINEALTDVEILVTTTKDNVFGGIKVNKEYLVSRRIPITNTF
jgi:hypothetical protein